MVRAMSERDLAGKVMLVTGANTGIGRVTAETLARRGARVLVACRSQDKAQPVVDAIAKDGGEAAFVALDLADLESVRACARDVLARDEPLHVLVNNAGLAGLRGLTRQGFELTFGVNHLGHFLLTSLLLPRLRASATAASPARIVNVASQAHYGAKRIDWDALTQKTRGVSGLAEYGVSKLCNVLFAAELARARAGDNVHAYSLHPGVVASDVWRQVPWPIRPIMLRFMLTTEQGAATTLYCAASSECDAASGRYYDKSREKKPSKLAGDEALAKELWARSEAWCGLA